jgi:hypothetical protein
VQTIPGNDKILCWEFFTMMDVKSRLPPSEDKANVTFPSSQYVFSFATVIPMDGVIPWGQFSKTFTQFHFRLLSSRILRSGWQAYFGMDPIRKKADGTNQ